MNALGEAWDRFYFYLVDPGNQATVNLVLRIMIGLMVGLLILVAWKARKAGAVGARHEFRIIIMGDGLNSWELIRNDGLSFDHGDYKVVPESLYKIRPDIKTRLRWRLAGIVDGFLIVFKKDEPKALKYEKPKRTAETILIVNESRALGQALKDEFKQAIGGRTLFIIVLVVVVGVLIYYFYTGRMG